MAALRGRGGVACDEHAEADRPLRGPPRLGVPCDPAARRSMACLAAHPLAADALLTVEPRPPGVPGRIERMAVKALLGVGGAEEPGCGVGIGRHHAEPSCNHE